MRAAQLELGRRWGPSKDLLLLGAAFVISMSVAIAAIGLAPTGAIDPGFRSLATQRITPAQTLGAQAFRSDDQACGMATRAPARGSESSQTVCDE